jgi:hypothetical protein
MIGLYTHELKRLRSVLTLQAGRIVHGEDD